jgi:hypothetical protein
MSQQARPITNQPPAQTRTTKQRATAQKPIHTRAYYKPDRHTNKAFHYRFSNNYTDARFYKIDVDEVPEVAQEQSVRAMPTFLLYKDGEKVGEVVGANPVALEAAIKTHNA